MRFHGVIFVVERKSNGETKPSSQQNPTGTRSHAQKWKSAAQKKAKKKTELKIF
jgi:hypothetical protein